jgi:hypothetical protein
MIDLLSPALTEHHRSSAPVGAFCDHALLRLVNAGERTMLDVRGMAYLSLDTAQQEQSSS